MAQYRDFLEELNVIVPGVARPIAEPVLKNVVRRFCEDSRIWRITVGPFPLTDAEREQPIDIATRFADELTALQADMVDVLDVKVGGQSLDKNDYQRRARTGFELSTRINDSRDFEVTVSLKPTREADTLPDLLLNDWEVEIAHGAAYRLVMQPGKDWSNPSTALHYQGIYERGKNRALFEANNDRQGSRTVKHNFFGG